MRAHRNERWFASLEDLRSLAPELYDEARKNKLWAKEHPIKGGHSPQQLCKLSGRSEPLPVFVIPTQQKL